jgi:hypothetical protein
MDRVPALSIRQPWAELIVSGKKTIEIRSWYTEYRGLLWIHTGLKSDPQLERQFGLQKPFVGGYVGSVVLTAVNPLDRERWENWSSMHLCSRADYRPGLYGWVLTSPHKFPQPIAGPGQLNLFFPNDELLEQLHRANAGEEVEFRTDTQLNLLDEG